MAETLEFPEPVSQPVEGYGTLWTWGPDQAERHLLCVHGIESHSQWFGPLAKFLSGAGWKVWAYDRPGHGHNQQRQQTRLVSAIDELAAVTSALSKVPGEWHWAGLSWGGFLLAYSLAFRRLQVAPKSTILISPALPPLPRIRWWSMPMMTGPKFWQLPLAMTPEQFCLSPAGQQFIREDKLKRSSVAVGLARATFLQTQPGALKKWPLSKVPTLVLRPEIDVIVNLPKLNEFAGRQGYLLQPIKSSGHSLVLDQPQLVAGAIERFTADQELQP